MINYVVHGMSMGLNWIFKRRWEIIIAIFFAALFLGSVGFYELISNDKFKDEPFARYFDSLYINAIILGFLNLIVGHSDNLSNVEIILSQALAYIALTFAVILTLLKKMVARAKLWVMDRVSHSLVIGLGQNNRTYLMSEVAAKNHDNIIIIETDPNNIYIEQFRELGFGVFIGTLDEYKVNFLQLQNVVISTGNDHINIELAGKLIAKIPDEMTAKEFGETKTVYIHIQNQDYKILFHQKILDVRKGFKLEFKPYSFYDDAVRQLFDKHTLLGNYHALAKTDDPYSIIVVGDGELAERIIYHLCILANLPNNNMLTIHCICEDARTFLARIRSNFTGIGEIALFPEEDTDVDSSASIRFIDHSLSMNTPEFFDSDVWKEDNLTNVFISNDNQNINFECAVNLHDKVYLEDAVEKKMKTKIHFAMYQGSKLRQSINKNKEGYKEFYTFGDAKTICDRSHLIDETHEGIAKLIHYGYAEKYNKNQLLSINDSQKKEEINIKWHDSTIFNKRESNRSQALHINTKLMVLGLKKVKIDEDDQSKLLEHNQQMMKQSRNDFSFTDDQIIDVSQKLYSDKEEDKADMNSFFDEVVKYEDMYSKLIKAEHERWNTFHYLNGWIYDKKRDDMKKHHNCLVPLEEFSDISRRETIVYDLYATLYIPNYLASTGYKIEKIEK